MLVVIPEWFFGFDSIMYFISALVGFLLSFYFHRMYSLSSEKKHMYLHLGFMLLSMGFLLISITNTFSYAMFWRCQSSTPSGPCTLSLLDKIFSLDDYAYLIYFGISIAAYLLFILAYSDYIKFSRTFIFAFIAYLILIVALLPTKGGGIGQWYSYSEYFHLTALIMLSFISFKNFVNYIETKNPNSLLVSFSFSSISMFHLFHLFAFVSGWMYVLGHIALLAGFLALMAMVLRVKKK